MSQHFSSAVGALSFLSNQRKAPIAKYCGGMLRVPAAALVFNHLSQEGRAPIFDDFIIIGKSRKLRNSTSVLQKTALQGHFPGSWVFVFCKRERWSFGGELQARLTLGLIVGTLALPLIYLSSHRDDITFLQIVFVFLSSSVFVFLH